MAAYSRTKGCIGLITILVMAKSGFVVPTIGTFVISTIGEIPSAFCIIAPWSWCIVVPSFVGKTSVVSVGKTDVVFVGKTEGVLTATRFAKYACINLPPWAFKITAKASGSQRSSASVALSKRAKMAFSTSEESGVSVSFSRAFSTTKGSLSFNALISSSVCAVVAVAGSTCNAFLRTAALGCFKAVLMVFNVLSSLVAPKPSNTQSA